MTNHESIVTLACRIAAEDQRGRGFRMRAQTLRRGSMQSNERDADIFETEASRSDEDICQLCVQMQRLCNGDESAANSPL